MRFVMCGAGAIGGVLGGQLARTGFEVIFIDKIPEHVETINTHGLQLKGVHGNHTLTIPAVRQERVPDPMETIDALMLGTKNAAKIHGVQAAFTDVHEALQTPDLSLPDTWTCQVDTGVSDEPWGFASTVQGAQNRAQAAYTRLMSGQAPGSAPAGYVALGIGVESGFIDVTPVTFTLYNFDVCALFDGQSYYLGVSPGFEYPRRLVRNIFLHRQPFQQARQYITTTADVEQQAGLVGVLAGGLIDRPEMTRLATRLALIRYLRRHDYARWD